MTSPLPLSLPPIHTEVSIPEIAVICHHFGLDALWQKIISDVPAKPFRSDGASCFPDQVGDVDIYPAAFLHDLKYWPGCPGEEAERFIADLELARDVITLCGGSVHLAELMLAGVRLGGSSHLPTPWRWGFGRT